MVENLSHKNHPPEVVFVWENFGPMHHDRLADLATAFPPHSVLGIEMASQSETYAWASTQGVGYATRTLFTGVSVDEVSQIAKAKALIKACRESGARTFFLCNYEQPYVFATAVALRFLGKRVLVMQNSKFNDAPRWWLKELLKVAMYAPYQGAITGSPSSAAYLRLLGFKRRPVVLGANAVSVQRFRDLAGTPMPLPFAKKPFVIIARLVPKKNLALALNAYALYAQDTKSTRPLSLYGNGPLEAELKHQAKTLGIEKHVTFHGFAQSEDVAPTLANALALILPSLEEQFGNVIIEAQALNIPVIASHVCGACDELVRNGTNGFTFGPDDAEGLAHWMTTLGNDEALWQRLSVNAPTFAALGDCPRFTAGCKDLIKRVG